MLREPAHRWGLLAAALALAVRLGLIAVVPVLPLGDSYPRLFHATSLAQGPWLPGLQLEIALLSLFTRASWVFRVVSALEGALSVGLAAATAVEIGGGAAGAMVGVALAGCPLLAWTSTAAYQEPLLELCAAGAAWCWVRGRPRGSVAWLLAAESVRYEAWLLALAWAVARRNPREAATLAVFPTVWMLFWRGLSPIGAGTLAPGFEPARLTDLAFAWHAMLPWWCAPGLLLLAIPGIIAACDDDDRVARLARFALAWGALDIALLAALHPYALTSNARQLEVATEVAAGLGVAGTAKIRSLAPRLAWLAPFAALPPTWHLAQINEWSDTIAARPAWSAGLGVAGALAPADRLLVLSQGWPRRPAAEPVECAVVGVASRRDDRSTICDSALPLEADPGDWAAEHDIHWILRLGGIEPWRPAHDLAGEVVARFGEAELVRLPGADPPR